MNSLGGLTSFWVVAMLTLHGVNLGEAFLNEPDVPFPPALPTAQNVAAICQNGNGRPRYPASFFPASGASHFRRRGNAINRLESWYSFCCTKVAQSQTLCCARQAWKLALSKFCDEEYSTMTAPYECCEDRGDARWKCFDSELPNPNYSPTSHNTAPQMPGEPGFTFDSNAC